MGASVQIAIAMVTYIVMVIEIGTYYAKRANANSDNYLIGGRSLGPWVTAMAAEASDMSGWLLMGLPGVAYWCGLGDALWTAVGLAIGTYLNWLLVAKRLRLYSHVAGDAITIPDFLSNRFKEDKKIIMTLAAIFILVFFTVYAASCFVTVGKLLSALFNVDYVYMMIFGALFVVAYTFVGGFLAESASDFLQAILMVASLAIILVIGIINAGGVQAVVAHAKSISGFFEVFAIALPQTAEGVQQVGENGQALFTGAANYGVLNVISALSWGLGYFGMPHVLLKFMAIDKPSELTRSRRVAVTWVVISLMAAIGIGIIGRVLFPTELLTRSTAENIFVIMTLNFLIPIIAGVVLSGIVAATISSSDSYLLIAASAVSKNLYQGIFKKDATDRQILGVSRMTLLIIALLAMIIALNENSVIFKVVAFAWAGFGATFGPLILLSLFWKRITRNGAIAGMVTGGSMVFIWKLLGSRIGGIFDIYELLPAFVLSCLAIAITSYLSAEESAEVLEEFELVRNSVTMSSD